MMLVAAALRDGRIGTPRLVYAEMEDGPVFRDKWATWRSQSGARWPGLHEFEIGCTLEHAGYALSWLVSLFGAVESLTAFSAITFPDKGPGTETIVMAPDFSVGCLQFRSGMVGQADLRPCGAEGPFADHRRRQGLDRRRATSGTTARPSISKNSAEPRKLTSRLAIRLEGLAEDLPAVEARPGRRLPYPAGKRRRHLPGLSLADRFLPGDRGTGGSDLGRHSSRSSPAAAPCTSPRSRWR